MGGFKSCLLEGKKSKIEDNQMIKVKQIVKHSYPSKLAFQARDRDSNSLGGTKFFNLAELHIPLRPL